jgi:hypothetical protein
MEGMEAYYTISPPVFAAAAEFRAAFLTSVSESDFLLGWAANRYRPLMKAGNNMPCAA